MSNKIIHAFALGLMVISFSSVAALQEIKEESLSQVTGEEGITITTQVPGELSYNIIYKDTQDQRDLANIILANSGGKDFTASNVTVDVLSLGDKAALQIGLPSRIEGKEFSMGDVYLSVDQNAQLGVSTALSGEYIDAPVRKTYQAVVTATNYRFDGDGNGKVGEANDRFNPDLGVNELELQIQDVGRTSSGNLSGSGQLRVESWHKYGDSQGRIDNAYLTNAETRRDAYATTTNNGQIVSVDKGNQGLEQGLTPGQGGIANLDRNNEFFFTKGVRTSLNGRSYMDIRSAYGASLSDNASPKGRMRDCNTTGGSCGDKSQAFYIGDGNTTASNGVVKYNINLTSRIDQTDSDKLKVGANNTLSSDPNVIARYTNNINNNRYENSGSSSNGQGGCYTHWTTGTRCEARPIVEGLSWYTNNKNYKPVSAEKYINIEKANSASNPDGIGAGAQLAHDPRVIFSVGKQTEVRIQAFNKKCTRWCGNDFVSRGSGANLKTALPRPAYRQATLDPAVVLLDSQGNVLATDATSGGLTKVGGTNININGSQSVGSNTDDHEFYPMGVIEATLGDPLYKSTKDRRLSTTRLVTAPESLAAQQLTTDQINLPQRVGMSLGGSVRVFGQ